MRKALLFITILSIQLGLNAQVTIHVEQGKDVDIVLHDSLPNFLNGFALYGDVVVVDDDTVKYGGTDTVRFNKNWMDKNDLCLCYFYRDPNKGVILHVSKDLAVDRYLLSARLATNIGKNKPDWCPANEFYFVLSVDEKIEKSVSPKEQPSNTDITNDKVSKDHFWNKEEYLPVLWCLLTFSLILIVALFYAYIKLKQKSKVPDGSIDDIAYELKNLKKTVSTLPTLDGVNAFITNAFDNKVKQAIQRTSNKSNPSVVTTPVISTPPVPPQPKPQNDSFDTLEYDFDKNLFVKTERSQDVFVIKQVGGKYSFTFKNSDVCRELLQSMQMYSGCVSLQGNTANVNGIASIKEGELRPMGDNRSFSVAKPIIVSLK